MMKRSSWTVVTLGVFALTAAAACGQTRRAADDDDGGAGGEDGKGGGSVTATGGSGPSASASTAAAGGTSQGGASSANESSASVSSSASGPQGCDSNVPSDFGQPECAACIECTQTGPCASEWSVCTSTQPCGQFIACLQSCDAQCNGDPSCTDACVGQSPDPNDDCSSQTPPGTCIGDHPGGCSDYLDALSCTVCMECPTNCNAAQHCS